MIFLKSLKHLCVLSLTVLLLACTSGNYPETPSIVLGPHQVLVRPGDTVYGIAYQNGVTTRDLIEANRLEPPYRIRIGQILILPDASKIATSSPSSQESLVEGEASEETESLKPLPLMAVPHESEPGDHPREGIKNLGDRAPMREENVLPKDTQGILKIPEKSAGSEVSKGSGQQAVALPSKGKESTLPSTSSSSQEAVFEWPVQGAVIGKYGNGVRIAAGEGTPVKAVQSGKVIYVGNEVPNLGNLVLIQHKGGWISAYGHLEKTQVKLDDLVDSQPIGFVGKTGGAKKAQLYFELRKNKKPVDPLGYLKP